MLEDLSGTSFNDRIELAIHQALLQHVNEVKERDRESSRGNTLLSTHDIYIKNRRLIRDLVEGRKDPNEFLEEIQRS